MQKTAINEQEEKKLLSALYALEDLAEKKTKIYSRLLIDTALAKEMEELSMRHARRKKTLELLATGKCKNAKKEEGEAQ
jgi:hypothetical protein